MTVVKMGQKQAMLWCRVDVRVKELVEKLAKTQGVTISEYMRQLVIEDLDKRSVFTTRLKKEVISAGESSRGSTSNLA